MEGGEGLPKASQYEIKIWSRKFSQSERNRLARVFWKIRGFSQERVDQSSTRKDSVDVDRGENIFEKWVMNRVREFVTEKNDFRKYIESGSYKMDEREATDLRRVLEEEMRLEFVAQDLREEIEKLVEVGWTREATKKLIEAFYRSERDKWQEWREGFKKVEKKYKKWTTVEGVSLEMNTLFLHGIYLDSEFNPAKFKMYSALKGIDDVSMIDRLKILFALSPSISSFTYSIEELGKRPKNTAVFGFGVVLRGGNIEMCSPIDAATCAVSLRQRFGRGFKIQSLSNILEPEGYIQTVREKVIESVRKKATLLEIRDGELPINEFVISAPQIAGIYLFESLLEDMMTLRRGEERIRNFLEKVEDITKN